MVASSKNILLIAPKFYDYHEKIIAQLERFNLRVLYFENKFFREDPLLYNNDLISRIKRQLNPEYKNNYNESIFKAVAQERIDFFFCIGGFSVTCDMVQKLKEKHPLMKSFIYFWDSFNVWDYRNLVSNFDAAFTFDPSDAEKYNLDYLPLFYYFNVNQFKTEKNIDLLYIGSVGQISTNRICIIEKFQSVANQFRLKSFFWLFYNRPKRNAVLRIVDRVRKKIFKDYGAFMQTITKSAERYSFIKFTTISSQEVEILFNDAKCVIDIPVPGQIGLTMRTIESLAAGAKLITTNKNIVKEEFFDPEWIYVINDDDITFDPEFLSNKPKKNIDLSYLSLENWLKAILLKTE